MRKTCMKGKLYYKHGEFCSDTNYPDNKSFSCITYFSHL
jgi:hypothetical protein